MITADTYKAYLLSQGSNMSQIKINQANMVMNQTFTIDPTYKKVYILTKDGWKFEDAKYQKHSTPSILKDAVDYYLQFRPKVHYPIGTYVFVPDDTSFDINLSKAELEDPFSLPDDRISQLWFIVGRDDALSHVRYNILKCNWNFKWIYNGELYQCWGSNRSANSYTSCNVSYKHYTARCNRKLCSVCSLIAGITLESYKLQHSDETNTSVNVKNYKNW